MSQISCAHIDQVTPLAKGRSRGPGPKDKPPGNDPIKRGGNGARRIPPRDPKQDLPLLTRPAPAPGTVRGDPVKPRSRSNLYVIKFPVLEDITNPTTEELISFEIPVEKFRPSEHAMLLEASESETYIVQPRSHSMPKILRTAQARTLGVVVEEREVRIEHVDKVRNVIISTPSGQKMSSEDWANLIVQTCDKAGYLVPKG